MPDPSSQESDGTSPAASATERGDASLIRLLQVIAVAANEARSIESALQICLDEVCAHTGWPVGHAFLGDREAGVLLSTRVWHLDDAARFEPFRKLTEETRFPVGEGLVGRVAAQGRPEWIRDVGLDPVFTRGGAADVGLRAGFVLPILIGPDVAGVLEFYTTEPLDPQDGLLGVMSQVGVQIGRVIERERAADALRFSEAKFLGIMSISSDAVVSVDPDQRITFFNQGAQQIFGYPAEEVLGAQLDILIPERFRGLHRAHLERFGQGPVAARHMGERGQITGRRKNGEIFPADASISKLHIGDQLIYTAVLRDVTDRVRAEQELARSNAELEQFAYVASHDLQEPLRMVASYTQLLARRYGEQLDDDAREFIGFAVDGVVRMQSLINDLLTFSRVGTRVAVFEPVDVNVVVDRVVATFAPAGEEEPSKVTRDELPTVTLDAMQLGQVFQNLIGNALKFERSGVPARVHVSAHRESQEWVFSVADNGIGIAPEYAERIFVLFQRLHSRSEYPGTGIGLAICKKIVERHGGRIWLESAEGAGTTFYFSIPDRIPDAR